MKRLLGLRWLFLSAAAIAALTEVCILFFPMLIPSLIDLMPASLPRPPRGFDVHREGVGHGKVETIEYDSKAAGFKRKMCVYTPPQFGRDKKYPVFYLLHGSLADETSWVKDGRLDAILDNLYAENKTSPMIVVMPDANLPTTDSSDLFAADMLGDVIPFVEHHFPVQADRGHRALAGVSLGANQALELGLSHPEIFAYLGSFIGGLYYCEQFEINNVVSLKDLNAKSRLKLLWFASGKCDVNDGYCQDTLKLLDKYNIRYTYVEGKGFHGWETSRNDLFAFVPLLFRAGE